MSDTDRLYQQTVDGLAAELLALSPDDLLARPEYGVLEREVNGEAVPVGYSRYALGDVHHIHFKASRRWFWFIHKSYVSGVVFGPDSTPRLMTPLKAEEYQ